jgi:hypothetical protein
MSRRKWQHNMQSRSATLGRYQVKDKAENAEIIDLVSGDADVIVIDETGSSNQGSQFVRKETTSSPNCVISIDDDDDDESATDSNAETSGSQYGLPRNRYGLDFRSEIESLATGTSGSRDSTGVGFSDGEGSDCEILDDSSGSIRQEWERAHSRKKMPPNKVESTSCENVKHHSNKPFENSFNDCFGDSSSSRNKDSLHEDDATCNVPNADSSDNLSKEKVSTKHKPWYEKEYKGFVPGRHQDEIRERVSPLYSFRSCSHGKVKSALSDNVVRSSEKIVVEEEIAKEAYNGVSSSEMLVEDEIAEEIENGRTLEKMNVEKENVREASLDLENGMNDKRKEKDKPSRDVGPSLTQNGYIASEANRHGENIGEESALACVTEANTGSEHDGCLVGEREKHKESEEYKRADEKEWASRQKQLQIQVGLVVSHVFFYKLQASYLGEQFIIKLIRTCGLHHRTQL